MVYVLLADGFEEIEALAPVDLLRRSGSEVVTVSCGEDSKVFGSHGITVTADRNIKEITDCKNASDHNALETLRLTDRAYLLFEGRILFQGTPEELANNPVVREKYLGSNFVLTRKDFQLSEELRNKRIEEQTRL